MEDDPEWEYSFSSILKCILKNGYVFGKNMVITGIVISSAPMVVVVFSAMGVGFGTYACTNKIMSILLPSPLDFEQQKYNHDDQRGNEEDEIRLENVVEEEDLNQGVVDDYAKQMMNVDEKEGVEMRLSGEDLPGDQSARDVERIEPVMVKEIDSQKLIMDKSKNNETVMRHILILDARQVMGDRNKKERNTESDEQVMMGTREEKTISNDKPVLRAKKEYLIADAREIGDESIHFASLEDIAALPAFKRTPLAMENEQTNTKMASREDMLDEERIWEKIVAMRTIVGYKAPSQPECIGELKALYVFTGVEPPASFKDDSDLDEVDAKLKFLMSIVGVK